MSWDAIRAAGRIIAQGGVSARDIERESHLNQLYALTGSRATAEAIAAEAARVGPVNARPAERAAIELAKAGFTLELITAALPAIFQDHGTRERMTTLEAECRAEDLASWVNLFGFTPDQVPIVGRLLRQQVWS